MRRAGVGLIAAVLALAGCKSTDPKPSDDKAPGGVASRPKPKDPKDAKGTGATGLSWLDDGKLPGTGTSIPKAGPSVSPTDPNYSAKAEAQDAIGGRVFDPNGKPARNVFVRIEAVGASADGSAPLGISANDDGYFFIRGLKPGRVYELVAEATQNGKALTGVVQTKVPNPILTVVLRDDLPPRAGGLPAPKGPGDAFPPTPRPTDKVGEYVPPAVTTPKPPADGAWGPGGSATGVPPPSISGGTSRPPTGGGMAPIPPPANLDEFGAPPGAKPVKPENVADGPKDPFKPPTATIPGPGGSPPVPPLPVLPPSFGPTGGGRSAMGVTTSAAGKLALIDVLERPWDLDSVRPGGLVLVEFMTTTCIPCKQSIPALKDMQSRYGASGLQLIGVVCDPLPQRDRLDATAKYARDNNLNYALFVEPGEAGSIRDQFSVAKYPTAVLLDSAGRELWRGHPFNERAQLESAIKQNLGK